MPAAKTENPPKAKGLRQPAFLTRTPAVFYDPMTLEAQQWRGLVAQAPIVRSCIATLIMQITGLEWYIEGDDEKEKDYFTDILSSADDGSGFENLVARVVEDALTVPFGGAWEIGFFPNGGSAWVAHLDAGLMRPTYSYDVPYAQVAPDRGPLDPVLFRRGEVSRVIWLPRPDVKGYGWTRTPCMDSLPAILGLLRNDKFWQTLLTDSPPPGILDIMGITDEDAISWLESWKTMMAGQDALKIPILTGEGRTKEDGNAQFISFATSATEAQLPELLRRYAEIVCAAFGMNTSDLGLFGQEMRLAGMTKVIELSKRQGLAHLMKGIKQRLDIDVLPDTVEFVWADVELEDTVRRATAKKLTAEALAALGNAYIFDPQVLQAQAIEEGLITVPVDTPPPQRPAPVAPAASADQPAGADATGTKGDLQTKARAGPKADALRQQGTTSDIPPRAYPTSSKASRQLGRIVGPWLARIMDKITRSRLRTLLAAGLDAAELVGSARMALEERQSAQKSAAQAAVEALLANEDWWAAPDISVRVAAVLKLAYAEGLVEAGSEIEKALKGAGITTAPALATTTAVLKDPKILALIVQRGADLVQRVDTGTKFYITQKILAGVERGISSPDIARDILINDVRRGIIETFRGRALSIVNTEINWAESKGTLNQHAAVGLTTKRWVAIPGIACDICQANMDEGVVPADFIYEDVFDSGCTGPPAHPTVCHCYITFDRAELLGSVA